jgi:hypothetical protein
MHFEGPGDKFFRSAEQYSNFDIKAGKGVSITPLLTESSSVSLTDPLPMIGYERKHDEPYT